MASQLARGKLARAALALNARARFLPALILMTDETRLGAALESARLLPKGSAVILRHTEAQARAELGRRLMPIVQARGLKLLVAGDAALAAKIGAHGLHFSEARAADARHWKTRRPDWLVSAAAHSLRAASKAAHAGVDAVLLAPVFPTRSHRERASLGPLRASLIALQSVVPVYALGGVNAATAARLSGAGFSGIAAIEGLAPDHSE
jgi:thiamine-phosphate pyrophosphorylase